jgi:hypothetical protein
MTTSPHLRIRLNLMQAFGDAIAYRMNRMARPCADCAPGRQCDDHATDSALIKSYRKRYRAVADAGVGELEAVLVATVPPAQSLREGEVSTGH